MVELVPSSERDADGAGFGSERERVAAHFSVVRARRSAQHWAVEDAELGLVERAVGLYCEEGLSLQAVAVAVERSKWWVEQRFGDVGVRVRSTGERPPTDPAVLAEVARLYGEGWVLTKIAAKVGRSTGWVRYRLDEAGVERRSRAVPTTEELVRLYCDEHLSVKDIAARFGRSTGFLSDRLRREGVEIRHGMKPPPTDPEVLERVVEMYEGEGFGFARIGREMGHSAGWVKSRLAEAGVEVAIRGESPPAVVAEVVRLYVDEQLSMRAISGLVGHGEAWVRSRLVAAGVEIRRPQPPSAEMERQIVDSYTAGELSVAAVALRVGVSVVQARRVLQTAGLVEAPPTDAVVVDSGRVRELFESTVLSVSEVAKQLGYEASDVESVIRRNGLVRRDNGNYLEISSRQLLTHLEEGLDVDAIAAHYDVTAAAVVDLVERHRTPAP